MRIHLIIVSFPDKALGRTMERTSLNKKLRGEIIAEAAGRCACDPIRYPHAISTGASELEVHHIRPWRVTRTHEPGNLIALCRNCHRKADMATIPTWALEQLKLVLPLRRLSPDQRVLQIKKLFRRYRKEKGKVLGEGYQTAAALLEHEHMVGHFRDSVRDWNIKAAIGFIKELQFKNDHVEPELVLAKLCLELDLTDAVFRILRYCTLVTRHSPQYAFMRGNANLRAGKFSRAVDWYRRAEANGYDPDSLYCNLGDALLYIGSSKKRKKVSEKYFRQAVAAFDLAPTQDTAVLFNKGRLMIELRLLREARTCFEYAIELGKHYPLPYVWLARLDIQEGNPTQALDNFDRAIERKPRSLSFLRDAEMIASEIGHYERADRYVRLLMNEPRYLSDEELQLMVLRRKEYEKRLQPVAQLTSE